MVLTCKLYSLSAPSKPRELGANITGPYSVRLRWKKPNRANGIIVLFKVRMFWRFKNVKGGYKYDSYQIPAKVTTRAGKRRFARDMLKYAVQSVEPVRDIELKRVQPFAIITIRVSEATRNADKELLWSPFSNNQTIQTMEGGKDVHVLGCRSFKGNSNLRLMFLLAN